MKILLIAVTVISSLLMVGVILLQQGKGAGLGSAFGSGAQGGLTGETGRANFLTRTTSVLVTVFFLACLTLSLFLSGSRDDRVRELLQDGTPAVQIPGEDSGFDDSALDAAGDGDGADAGGGYEEEYGDDDLPPAAPDADADADAGAKE